ncbi:CHASE2 domain-containing protein [Paraconexibacter algicola]|uniref:Guanylate cyclase domain-containing protein n=1 Tax=Paraconexibacter algicola TaxID=2133960 RepID=A0A2T4UMF4_9ACTN|nr:adenylate/guanylate cyclase domain-containing protein [Paraconexibacter algicola]PTL60399.1 hypothetical protein C7Y72_12485 [Paraconexibacter algicola]
MGPQGGTTGGPGRLGRARASLRAQRLLVLPLLGTIAIAVVLAATPVLDGLERASGDVRFAVRGEQTPREDLVVVAVDDRTFSDLDQRWPFPRSLHARAIERIAADRPRAIVYDVQFSEETDPDCDPDDPDITDACIEAIESDNALLLALREAGDVVLATTEVSAAGRPNLLGGDPEALAFSRARPGIALFPIDPGGVYRRGRVRQAGLPTLAVATAEVVRGRRLDPTTVPQDPFLIDYAGPPGTVPQVSFSSVVGPRPVPRGTFRDRIVVVGPVATTLQDVHPTSFASAGEMSGAEIQANAIATVLDGFPLRTAPRWLAVLLAAMLAGLPVAAGARLGGGARNAALLAAVALVAAGLLVGAALLAFSGGFVLPVAAPLVALALGTVVALVTGSVREAVEREFTRRVFARFVSDDVVDQVLARAERDGSLRLGGERMETTVLLSDIRGFTTFSERNRPEVVLELLNRYLSTMTEAILDRGGTVTGFLGDGIIAVFGAPVPHPDHADRAVRAAQDMLVRCAAFNAELAAEGRDVEFRMGIGLNSGPVMAGNVGSQRRLDYTVIGDVVNTAARLEGATKGTPHDLFVAGATYQALLEDHPELVFHDTIALRGRAAGVPVYVPRPTAE